MDGELEWRDIDSVALLENNPKDHDIGAICESLTRFGLVEAMALNLATGRVIRGNGTTTALRYMKRRGDSIPVGVRDGWLAPYFCVRVQVEDEQRVALALNRISELGGWDYSNLASILEELAQSGRIEGTGYDTIDVANILQQVQDNAPNFEVLVESRAKTEETLKQLENSVDIARPTDTAWMAVIVYQDDPRLADVRNALQKRLLPGSKHLLDSEWFIDEVLRKG